MTTHNSRALLTSIAALALAIAALLAGTAAQADAAARDGSCDPGEFCLFHNASQTGAVVDFIYSQPDYSEPAGCIKFEGRGAGTGTCVKNHAVSAWNRTDKPTTVFFNTNYGGVFQIVAAYAKPNLNPGVSMDNASHIIGDASIRFPLATTQARIRSNSPAWCFTSDDNCHHDYNAADIFTPQGTKVLSPVNGTVKTVNVHSGGFGSTATIKDQFGRLWFLDHMDNDPGPQVRVNQTVSKGTLVGYVGSRDQAGGTDTHLHIDMQVGYDERPACSAAACSSYSFVNNQPLLRLAFSGLPAS